MKIVLFTRNRPYQIYLINHLSKVNLLHSVIQEIPKIEKIKFNSKLKFRVIKYYREVKKVFKEPLYYFKKKKVITDLYGNQEIMNKRILKHQFEYIEDEKLKILNVESINNDVCYDYLKEIKPDIILIFGTGIVQQKILKLASICSLNLHFGISPYYRGGDTLLWPCVNNDFEHLGITIHEPIDKPDAGPIVFTEKIMIDENDNIYSLHLKATKLGVKYFIKSIDLIKNNCYKSFAQNLSIGRQYYSKETFSRFDEVLKFYQKWKKGFFKHVSKQNN